MIAIYADSLLRASLVVECDGELYIVPRCEGGWVRRQQLTLTDEARRQRLRPAKVDAFWLGIEISTDPT